MAALEKQNRELSWQVAMLTRGGGAGGGSSLPPPCQPLGVGGPPGSVAVGMPKDGGAAAAAAGPRSLLTLPGLLGLVLRYRKWLVIGYLVVLHIFVYLALTHGALFRSSTAAAAAAAAASRAALKGGAAATGGVGDAGNTAGAVLSQARNATAAGAVGGGQTGAALRLFP